MLFKHFYVFVRVIVFSKKEKRMKKKRQSQSHLLALLACLLYMPGIYAATWTGAVVSNVTDEDLVLDASGGVITPPAATGISISAITTDVNVTLANGDVTVAPLGGDARLYIFADIDRTVTFDLTGLFDLTFTGGPADERYLIVVGGQGTVRFLLTGGRTLTFTSDGANGPVSLYLLMQESDEYTPRPTLLFDREDLTSEAADLDINIVIGPNSLISYLSNSLDLNGTDSGEIVFNPSNIGEGNMVLDIADTGAYLIEGRFVETLF